MMRTSEPPHYGAAVISESAAAEKVECESGYRRAPAPLAAVPVVVPRGRAAAGEHGRIAVLEIRDGVGERSERDGVGAEIHFALAVTDRERRALARTDEEVFLAAKQEGKREGAAQPR